jgi:hypothetical protein
VNNPGLLKFMINAKFPFRYHVSYKLLKRNIDVIKKRREIRKVGCGRWRNQENEQI